MAGGNDAYPPNKLRNSWLCGMCGTEIDWPLEARYCYSCGHEIDWDEVLHPAEPEPETRWER